MSNHCQQKDSFGQYAFSDQLEDVEKIACRSKSSSTIFLAMVLLERGVKEYLGNVKTAGYRTCTKHKER